MLQYPNINPVALDLGFFQVHWYGISYLVAFLLGWKLASILASRPNSGWTKDELADFIFYVVLGVIVGGKLGSVLFYNTGNLLSNPLQALNPMNAGMSFHGGFIGVLVGLYMYGRKTNRTFFQVSDFIAPTIPVGLGLGRIGNFINGELWGRPTDVPWGMVFPHVDNLPRHPNQIYQFIGEGIILLALMWFFAMKKRPRAVISGMFCISYGIYRFLVEFVREPDRDLGFIAFDWLTMGQLLSFPMIIAGAIMMYVGYKRNIID